MDPGHAGEVVARPQLRGHLRDQLGAGLGGEARRARREVAYACNSSLETSLSISSFRDVGMIYRFTFNEPNLFSQLALYFLRKKIQAPLTGGNILQSVLYFPSHVDLKSFFSLAS